jgi:hypothetical protein
MRDQPNQELGVPAPRIGGWIAYCALAAPSRVTVPIRSKPSETIKYEGLYASAR